MFEYGLTIFLGAFLLFQVQPLIAKYILPWFGGGPGVWTACMLFFQLALLAGYAYAHVSSHWLRPKRQLFVHVCLLILAVALLPITPSASWKPHGNENPTWQILALLAANIGLPYFVLSATGPLLQQWFSKIYPTASPYPLYALSNTGSLVALLSYPFLFENHFSRKSQASIWQWGLVLYALCCGFCTLQKWKRENRCSKDSLPQADPANQTEPGIPLFTWVLWLLWPACGSVLLLAITNKICMDVAVVPFLWVVPLALYLLSFVICFAGSQWYKPVPFTVVLFFATGAIAWTLLKGSTGSLRIELAIYLAGLFLCCMVCHGELFRLKPHPSRLTSYYLMISAGGAVGGLFVALVAPIIFRSYLEVHYGLVLCALLLALTRTRQSDISAKQWRALACILTLFAIGGLDLSLGRLASHSQPNVRHSLLEFRIGVWVLILFLIGSWAARKQFKSFIYWKLLSRIWIWLGCLVLAVVLWIQGQSSNPDIVHTARNFYGVLKVFEHDRDKPLNHHFLLQHGRVTHGIQFADARQSSWPTSYYSEQSGIGLVMSAMGDGLKRVGVVGLGAGTIAAYGRPGDFFRFYEINPEVGRVARKWFSYLTNCPAQVELVPGDARLSMEGESPQDFDLLALDAFSSDAIPVHLLTTEAFALYNRHMKTNGVIAVHISNHYLDLEPVLLNVARQFNYRPVLIDFDELEDEWWRYSCSWMLLTRNYELLETPSIRWAATPPGKTKLPLWTDDFASLFQILK